MAVGSPFPEMEGKLRPARWCRGVGLSLLKPGEATYACASHMALPAGRRRDGGPRVLGNGPGETSFPAL